MHCQQCQFCSLWDALNLKQTAWRVSVSYWRAGAMQERKENIETVGSKLHRGVFIYFSLFPFSFRYFSWAQRLYILLLQVFVQRCAGWLSNVDMHRERVKKNGALTYKYIDHHTQDKIMFDNQWGYPSFLYFIKRHDCENTNIIHLKETHQGIGSTQFHWSQLLCKLYSPSLQACFRGSNKYSFLSQYHLFKYEGYEWMPHSARRVPWYRCIFTPSGNMTQ